MFEKAQGTAQKIAGQFQDVVGGATGNAAKQLEGKARHWGGQAQESCGDALNQIRQSATANPLVTVALIAGLALLVGAAISKR